MNRSRDEEVPAAVAERARALREALQEKGLVPEYPHVAFVLHHRTWLYRAKGDYARAEPLEVRSLVIVEKALGP